MSDLTQIESLQKEVKPLRKENEMLKIQNAGYGDLLENANDNCERYEEYSKDLRNKLKIAIHALEPARKLDRQHLTKEMIQVQRDALAQIEDK